MDGKQTVKVAAAPGTRAPEGTVPGEQHACAPAAGVREPLGQGTSGGGKAHYKANLQGLMARLEMFALAATALFLVWRAVDLDMSEDPKSGVSIVVQYVFLVVFLADAGIRVSALESRRGIARCPMLIFDLILAVLLAIETIASSYTWWLWLSQLGRFGRLVAAVPETRILVMGLWAAMRAVFFCILLNTMNIYIFALALCKLTRDTAVGKAYFPTVPEGMFSLLSHGVLFDGLSVMFQELKNEAVGLIFVFLVFMVINFTLVALTAGVICEVLSQVASIEKDKLMAQYMATVLRRALGSEGAIAECLTSKEALVRIVSEPNAELSMVMRCMQVDVAELATYADGLFMGKPYQSLEELSEELLEFGASRPVKQRHLMRMERRLRMRGQ